MMYVSVTGLKTHSLYASMKFWFLTIPALRAAQRADGILLCENKSRNGCHHTLTVWKSRAHMLEYVRSPKHVKAIRSFSSIAVGRLLSYESNIIPSWEEALLKLDQEARNGWTTHHGLNLAANTWVKLRYRACMSDSIWPSSGPLNRTPWTFVRFIYNRSTLRRWFFACRGQ